MSQGHILKFMQRQHPSTRASKRFHPEQTFGTSKQSPDWFKRKFSLQPENGYQYKYDTEKFREKFKYLSQKNAFRINNPELINLKDELIGKQSPHNRKKGLLSQFLDNNAWMKATIPIIGVQRSPQSRELSNSQRQKMVSKIQKSKSVYSASKTHYSNFYKSKNQQFDLRKINTSSQKRNMLSSPVNSRLRQQNNYEISNNQNPSAINQLEINSNVLSQKSSSIPLFIKQTTNIRAQRNQAAFNTICQIQKIKFGDKFQKTLAKNRFRTVDSEFVTQRMAITARQWKKGKTIPITHTIERFDEMINNNSMVNSNLGLNRILLDKKLSAPSSSDLVGNLSSNKYQSTHI